VPFEGLQLGHCRHLLKREFVRNAFDHRQIDKPHINASPKRNERGQPFSASSIASGAECPCKLGLEGIVSKRRDSVYSSGRWQHWIKSKNPEAPAVRREAEEDWSGRRQPKRLLIRERA
jgi:hypothetical protein